MNKGIALGHSCLALLATFSLNAYPADKEVLKSIDPYVRLETSVVHDQCTDSAASVMLNNTSILKYRITVLKRKVYDEQLIKVLEPKTWTWIGCVNDGYSYSIKETVKL